MAPRIKHNSHARKHSAAHPPVSAQPHPAAVAAPAAPPPPAPARQLKLPSLVASVSEVGRLVHELDMINESFLQMGIRAPGTSVQMPKTSRFLEQLAEVNKLNLLQPADREQLMQFLTRLRTKAPVMHFSFSADPSAAFVDKLIVWLRREIHPDVLLSIGLQPNIGAGCVVRTTNKSFDLSLRQDFISKRPMLLQAIKATSGKPPTAQVEAVP